MYCTGNGRSLIQNCKSNISETPSLFKPLQVVAVITYVTRALITTIIITLPAGGVCAQHLSHHTLLTSLCYMDDSFQIFQNKFCML